MLRTWCLKERAGATPAEGTGINKIMDINFEAICVITWLTLIVAAGLYVIVKRLIKIIKK